MLKDVNLTLNFLQLVGNGFIFFQRNHSRQNEVPKISEKVEGSFVTEKGHLFRLSPMAGNITGWTNLEAVVLEHIL